MNSIKKNCGANMLSTYNSPSSKKKWANLDKCDTLVSEYTVARATDWYP